MKEATLRFQAVAVEHIQFELKLKVMETEMEDSNGMITSYILLSENHKSVIIRYKYKKKCTATTKPSYTFYIFF